MDWKTKAIVVMVAAGAIFGFVAARLYIRQVEEYGDHPPQKVNTGTALSIGLAALAVVRQIAQLGEPEEQR